MDAKKVIEYGVIAVIAYLALTWIFSTIGALTSRIGGGGDYDPSYPGPVIYPQFVYSGGSGYGNSPVRWGGGGYRGGRGGNGGGRRPGTGGY